jgi:hypothetical protein
MKMFLGWTDRVLSRFMARNLDSQSLFTVPLGESLYQNVVYLGFQTWDQCIFFLTNGIESLFSKVDTCFGVVLIIISLLMSPLLGQRPSLWIKRKEDGP